jgi:hypothetical protein
MPNCRAVALRLRYAQSALLDAQVSLQTDQGGAKGTAPQTSALKVKSSPPAQGVVERRRRVKFRCPYSCDLLREKRRTTSAGTMAEMGQVGKTQAEPRL